MHFRKTNRDPSVHFRKANTDPSVHFRKAKTGFLLQVLLPISLLSLLHYSITPLLHCTFCVWYIVFFSAAM